MIMDMSIKIRCWSMISIIRLLKDSTPKPWSHWSYWDLVLYIFKAAFYLWRLLERVSTRLKYPVSISASILPCSSQSVNSKVAVRRRQILLESTTSRVISSFRIVNLSCSSKVEWLWKQMRDLQEPETFLCSEITPLSHAKCLGSTFKGVANLWYCITFSLFADVPVSLSTLMSMLLWL